MAAPKDSTSQAETKPDAKSDAFKAGYETLLKLKKETPVDQQQAILSQFIADHTNTFNFKLYTDFVTKDSNAQLFEIFVHFLNTNKDNFDLLTSIFQTIRVLTRSKTGLDPLFSEEFHLRVSDALKSNRRKLIVQALAATANLLFINKEKVTEFSLKHKTYIQISDIMTNKNGTFKKTEDKISLLGLNCLFYLVLNKDIGTAFYNDNSFFQWLFDLFLEKTQYFNDKKFWIRNKLKAKKEKEEDASNAVEDEKSESNNDDNGGGGVSQYNTDEDCRLVQELLRILFNFTLVETNVLRFKLDTFKPDYQRAVVGRAVQLLTIPCEYEPEFDLFCNAKLQYLIETPGLISIKIKLCNVALYDGDILGMNLPVESADAVCKLMEFYCMQTRQETRTAQQIAAMMMFLKAVCKYNGKVRMEIKRYIFGDDAETDKSDDEEEEEEDDNEHPVETRNKMMKPKHLDEVKKGETTIKNYLIECCTSVNYNIKRTVAEFLFSLCGDNQQEMIRLCGLGNAIGIFVDKGIPGFAGAADRGTNLEKLAKLKKMQEKEKKAKEEENANDGKDKQPPSQE